MAHPTKPTKPKTVKGPGVSNPTRTSQLIHFYGYWHGIQAHSFQALAQEQPPTWTGGWANVSNVTRPRSLDYTMVTDYPAITMDIPIRFDNWVGWSSPINADVEADLRMLTWMAGRGNLGPGRAATGDPPIIKIAAYSFNGTRTSESSLIPPDFQGLEWIISNLSFDTSPLRFSSEMIAARKLEGIQTGDRARQDVTVTLTQWVPAPGFRTSKSKPTGGAVFRRAGHEYNTIQKMCAAYFDRKLASDWKTVMELPANQGLHLRSARKALKIGTKVWFPASFESEKSEHK